jgi:2-keto-4-pentenoate hydratase
MPSLDTLIDALLLAHRTPGQPADATPFASTLTTPDDAYLAQDLLVRELNGRDAVPHHWKAGAASRSASVGHSPLPEAGVHASPFDARRQPGRHRLVEAEIALRLACDVDEARAATLDEGAALGLIDAMAVAIELADSRWQQAFAAPALLRTADLQSHAALVIGDWVPFAPRDWAAQPCRVQIGDRTSEHPGAHACGDPAWVLPQWLRRATRDGAVLRAGSVVITGSWCGALPAQPGETATVVFDGIGQVQVQF